MKNFELIDDYVANRLDAAQRTAFDEQLGADPALRSEVEMQQQIVAAIRTARALELKTLLNNVPIETSTFALPANAAFRIAAGIAGIGVLVAATFYYIRTGHSNVADSLSSSIAKRLPLVQPANEPKAEEPTPVDKAEAVEKPVLKNEIPANQKKSVQKPTLSVADPSQELTEEFNPEPVAPVTGTHAGIAAADMRVTVDHTNSKFNFHYQFEQGALRLFGPFDRGLFEVLEVQGEPRSLFLYYQSNYYGLSGKQNQITRLEAVTNAELLRLLKEYHRK